MSVANSEPAPVSVSKDAFAFVQALATELSRGKVELPSFPEVAMRLQRLLSDPNVQAEAIVRAISAEPVLAVRVLQMANSAALNLSGRQVTELRTAVARLGFNLLRSAAYSFVVAQIRMSQQLKSIQKPLKVLWERSALVAAICFVVARRNRQVNADSAFLAGLLHGVGRLYILTRTSKFPDLLADPVMYAEIERDWHAGIAKTLLENWEIAEDIVLAVQEYEDFDREPRGTESLADVLTIATLLADVYESGSAADVKMDGIKSWARLGIDRAGCEEIFKESAEEVAALRSVLGS